MSAAAATDPYASRHHSEPARWQHVGYYLVLLVIAAGDAINFKLAFALLYANEDDTTLNILVGTATLAALLMMMFAGHEGRKRTAGDPSARTVSARAVMAAWLLMGLTAFAVRLLAPAQTADTGSGFAVIGHDSDTTPQWVHALPSALLFLGIYLGCGIIAYLVAYQSFNVLRRKLIVARGRFRRAQRKARRTAHRLARAQSAHETLEADEAEWEVRRQAMAGRLQALASEARAHARLEIASRLGSPASTSGVIRDVTAARDLRESA